MECLKSYVHGTGKWQILLGYITVSSESHTYHELVNEDDGLSEFEERIGA
jgi:hypothetical protein